MPDVRSKIVGIIRFDDRGCGRGLNSWSDDQRSATLSQLLTGERAVGGEPESQVSDRLCGGVAGRHRCQRSWLSISHETQRPADVASIYAELCELLTVYQR